MPLEKISIPAEDGVCHSSLVLPEGDGPHPTVIYYMDAFGIRPALTEMAERLVQKGYAVLIPDLFYRFGPYGPLDVKDAYARGHREIVGPMRATMTNAKAATDTGYLLDYLDSRSDLQAGRYVIAGFCMGGGFAVIAAGTHASRVAAIAAYHAGNLATDAPDSPHLLAPRMTGEIYVGGAENDGTYPPEMAERLDQALTDAGVRHVCEFYPGAKHGWMMPDSPAFNAGAAELGWQKLENLIERTFR